MARKKKTRKKSRSKKSNGILSFFGHLFQVSLKVIPIVIILTLGSGLFLGVRHVLYADTSLAVQNIIVEPIQGLSAATKQRLENTWVGHNILKVDLKAIAKEIEKDPSIQSAFVTRQFPAGLKIEILKRIPVGLIQFRPKGSYGLISDDGMILDVLKGQSSAFIVFETFATSLTSPRVGMRVKSAGYDEAVKFIRAYWKHSLAKRETIDRIILDQIGSTTIHFVGGPSVKLGRKPLERLDAIEKILPILEKDSRDKIEYIDLQYDDVIVKKRR